MSIESINEPGKSRVVSHTPRSINEPPELPDIDVPAPVITALDPTECAIGSADFTLDVTGENFFAGTVIFFAGHDEPTSFDGTDTVSTGVKPSLWGAPATVTCQVHNGESMSNQMEFNFTDAGVTRAASHMADPDELEDEIDEAIENDDIKPTHASRPKRKKR